MRGLLGQGHLRGDEVHEYGLPWIGSGWEDVWMHRRMDRWIACRQLQYLWLDSYRIYRLEHMPFATLDIPSPGPYSVLLQTSQNRIS